MSARETQPNRIHERLSTIEQLLAIDATEVRATLQQAATLISRVLDAEKVDIFCCDERTATLVALGVSDTPLARREQAIGLDRVPLANEGRAVQVYRNGVPYLEGHVEEDMLELVGIRVALGIRSSLITPLVVNGERRGVIDVTSTQPERFTDDDLGFMQTVSRWIGMVMHRAELVEEMTRDAARMARHAVAEELIAIFVHDFRTPLTPLQGNIQMLQERALREGRDDDLRIIERTLRTLDRLRSLTTDILDASRIDQGIFALNLDVVDMRALVASTVELLRNGRVPVELRSSGEAVIEGDPERLRQVIENLLANALRFSPDDVAVEVEVSQVEDEGTPWTRLSIRDHGTGIALDLQEVLFDRFAISRHASGLGLGLYLARGIVEAHGGTLAVTSAPKQGTTVEVLLPTIQNGAP